MSRRGNDKANHDPQIADVLPLAALDQRVAIVGTSGAGKTYAAKSLVERLLAAGVRVCVVDPLGVWRGLRAGADGATPGYPVVVFGGRHADIRALRANEDETHANRKFSPTGSLAQPEV